VDLVWEKEFIELEKPPEIHPETLTLDPNQRVPGVPTFGSHLCATTTVASVA
jgi:hypothetical protein